MKQKIIDFLQKIFTPRITYTYNNKRIDNDSKEARIMNRGFAKMDEAFKKMDDAFNIFYNL